MSWRCTLRNVRWIDFYMGMAKFGCMQMHKPTNSWLKSHQCRETFTASWIKCLGDALCGMSGESIPTGAVNVGIAMEWVQIQHMGENRWTQVILGTDKAPQIGLQTKSQGGEYTCHGNTDTWRFLGCANPEFMYIKLFPGSSAWLMWPKTQPNYSYSSLTHG